MDTFFGCTSQLLKDRVCRHIYDVGHTHDRNVSAVSMHFSCVHGGSTEYMRVQGIERVLPSVWGGNL